MDQPQTQPEPVSPPSRAQSVARIVLASALGLLGLWIILGFVPALAWAVIIAIALDPLYLRLRAIRPGRAGQASPRRRGLVRFIGAVFQ